MNGFPAARVVAVLLVSISTPAFADDKRRCADAYEESQRHRNAGDLVVARAELVTCQRTCKAPLQDDCTRWFAEVDALIPRLQVRAVDGSGRTVRPVSVSAGKRRLSTDVSARPIELNPGKHSLRFEAPGYPALERTIDLPPGGRVVELSLQFEGGAKPREESSVEARPPLPPPVVHDRRPTPSVAVYVLASVGVAGVLTGATFGIVGHAQRSRLKDTCSPNCSDEAVDRVRRSWLIGGVSAAVGVAAGAGALWLWQSENSAASVGISPWVNGRGLAFDAQF